MKRERRSSAFTLLEVMAAVLVLGMLYTVLADAAIRGLRSEGESRRRSEASLVADRFLSDLEMQLALGQIPPNGSEEETLDAFRVGLDVEAYDPTPLLEAIEREEERRGLEKPRASSSAQRAPAAPTGSATDPAAPPIESLFTPPRAGEEGRLRRIEVWVAWQEGDREARVTRTTFAFDTTGLEEAFPERAGPGSVDQELENLPQEEALRRMQEIMDQLEAEQ